MIHGDQHSFHMEIYPQQLPDENSSSLYHGINIGPFSNNDATVDLVGSINSADLLDLQENEISLNNLLQESNNLLPENKPRMLSNTFPNLEEHDDGGYKFELNLNPNSIGKSNWYYSPKLQKVFIKLDQTFYIEALYSPKILPDILYMRAMMVFVDDISSPVQRCHNHMNSDHSSDSLLRYYILRSENTNTRYEGISEGRNVNDRLSIVIPLSQGRPNENNVIKESIALKFVCQNSCIGRKQTAVIFTLEDQNYRVLGKRVVNVKVCSCPKRDKQKDEEKNSLKRPGIDQNGYPPNKIPSVVRIKTEPIPSTSPQSNSSPSEDNKYDNKFQEVKLTFTIPQNLANEVSRAVFSVIAGKMALDTKNTEKYRKCMKEVKKKLDEIDCSCPPDSNCCSKM